MTFSLDQSEKESFLLVSFAYGAGLASRAYYTNWSEDYGIYVATPAMKVILPPNSGKFEDKPADISMPSDDFVDRLTDGMPHSEVTVQIDEMTRSLDGSSSAKRLVLFIGTVVSTVRNAERREGRVIRARPAKEFLDVQLGPPVDHQCWLTFNGPGCDGGSPSAGAPSGLISTGDTIVSIEGRKITVSAGPSHAVDHHYLNGYMERDGLRIKIRAYDAGVDDKVFYLSRQPPSEWEGQAVTIVAGCTKTKERCAEWSNLDNFNGVGIAIPKWHPSYEDSP